jgi:hypothetical protein
MSREDLGDFSLAFCSKKKEKLVLFSLGSSARAIRIDEHYFLGTLFLAPSRLWPDEQFR